jgi:hypothetical protein
MSQGAAAAAAGLAAGFDKDAEAIKGLMGLGLGFMEVGEAAAGSTTSAWGVRRRSRTQHSKLALCNFKHQCCHAWPHAVGLQHCVTQQSGCSGRLVAGSAE